MEGRARAATREFEGRLSQAWHTEAFAREKKLRPLGKYLNTAEKQDTSRGAGALLATLREMKERGVPMTIRRLDRKPAA